MKHITNSSAIALTNIKNAALYFKYIFPLDLSKCFPENQQTLDGLMKVQRSLYPPSLLDETSKTGLSDDVKPLITYFLGSNPDLWGVGISEKRIQEYKQRYYDTCVKLVFDHKFPLDNLFLSLSDSSNDESLEHSVTLSNLGLIDTSKLSWNAILEIRKDKNSISKLRNLRLFLVKEYESKDSSYIREDLERRVEEYSCTVKEWGFETRDSILSSMFSSKSVLASAGAIPAAILAGGPIASLLTPIATFGLAFEIGKTIINIQTRRRKLRKFIEGNPLTYIVDAREHYDNPE